MNIKRAWKRADMIKKGIAITLLFFSGVSLSYAGIEIIDSDADSDALYGNGQNATFRRAMEGDTPIDEQDQVFLDSIVIKRPANRSYIRARLGRPKFELKKITNVSGGSTAAPTVPESSEKLWQWSLAYGYKWQNWMIEAELLMAEPAHYNASPMLQGAALGSDFYVNARIKNYTPMLNVEYEFGNEMAFLPKRLHLYLSAGIGAALIKTEANTYSIATNAPLASESHRGACFAWNLGAGLRYDIVGNLLFDLSYRYMDFGKTQIGPVSGATLKIDDVLSSGLFAGLVYRL
jgi:opacity protein-like surface antigen